MTRTVTVVMAARRACPVCQVCTRATPGLHQGYTRTVGLHVTHKPPIGFSINIPFSQREEAKTLVLTLVLCKA